MGGAAIMKPTCRCSALLIGLALGATAAWSSSEALGADVLERSYNGFRTGANTAETVLTPANVRSDANQFHRRFVLPVDGKIEGSPLYASDVELPAARTTSSTSPRCTTPSTRSMRTRASNSRRGGSAIRSSARTSIASSRYHPYRVGHRQHAGDRPFDRHPLRGALGLRERHQRADLPPFRPRHVRPDQDKFGSVLIDGYNVNGKGFDRYRQMQRAGLALAKKPSGEQAVVVAFGGGEGQGSPSGWVVAFDTAKLAKGTARRTCGAAVRTTARAAAGVRACGWPMRRRRSTPMATSTS